MLNRTVTSYLPEGYPTTLRCFFCLDVVYYTAFAGRPIYVHLVHSYSVPDVLTELPAQPRIIKEYDTDRFQSYGDPLEQVSFATRYNTDHGRTDSEYWTECAGAAGLCDGVWGDYYMPGFDPLFTWTGSIAEGAREYVQKMTPGVWAYYDLLRRVFDASGLYY